ncbi:MAG: site-specific integrase [Chloroflexi bacterium]|nr:site-specific integrase [Chloroflexota bacterium]
MSQKGFLKRAGVALGKIGRILLGLLMCWAIFSVCQYVSGLSSSLSPMPTPLPSLPTPTITPAPGRRTILLGDTATAILRKHLTEQFAENQVGRGQWNEWDLIFPDEDGRPMDRRKLVSRFKAVIQEVGLPEIRFHDLRHTAASLMLNNGIPILIVSNRLGHAKPSITLDVYGHMIPSKQEEVAELMDELLTPLESQNCTIFAPNSADLFQNEV